MSIDWEDFGQLYTKYHFDKITPALNAIERQTEIILRMLDRHEVKSTFFVLGLLAKDKPDLVRRIHNAGHEIALHGSMHESLLKMTREEIKKDISNSMEVISEIIDTPVYGYRAPYFSMTSDRLFVLEILTELGLVYDSSIIPSAYVRFGIPDFMPSYENYELKNGKQIVELPISTIDVFNRRIAVAGGSYLRISPKWVFEGLCNKVKKERGNIMLYMHPYEFDSESIDVGSNYPVDANYSKTKRYLLNLKWNLFRPSIIGKLEGVLNRHEFHTCKEIANWVRKEKSYKELSY